MTQRSANTAPGSPSQVRTWPTCPSQDAERLTPRGIRQSMAMTFHECLHSIRRRLGRFAQGPPDGCTKEDVVVVEVGLDGVAQKASIGLRFVRGLREDARAVPPSVARRGPRA